ncbi:hypothetical protein LCGC14_1498700 [marine sediment metagenome]|uniref:Uncharacterized protein n=1 Tax=marine sediment metagenome TaxID=412755 RepID=A0A0F9J4N5_9ZZZZ
MYYKVVSCGRYHELFSSQMYGFDLDVQYEIDKWTYPPLYHILNCSYSVY